MCFLHFAREAAGALGARHSPRPLLGERFMHDSGVSRRGIADLRVVVIARSDLSAVAQRAKAEATKQSILSLRGEMDCFASLAMTWKVRRMGFAALDPFYKAKSSARRANQ